MFGVFLFIDASHFIHGVDYEGYICHSEVILPDVIGLQN